MFTKPKKVADLRVQGYKKVIDWDAVCGAIVIGVIAIAILGNL